MSEYRIYTIGRDGHFSNAENIECADDHEAIAKARRAIDGRDVELWQVGPLYRALFAQRVASIEVKETASQGTVAQIIKFVRPEMAFNPEEVI